MCMVYHQLLLARNHWRAFQAVWTKKWTRREDCFHLWLWFLDNHIQSLFLCYLVWVRLHRSSCFLKDYQEPKKLFFLPIDFDSEFICCILFFIFIPKDYQKCCFSFQTVTFYLTLQFFSWWCSGSMYQVK